MLTFTDIDKYLKDQGLEVSDAKKNGLVNYKLNQANVAFASKIARPLRLSLRCSRELSKYLCEKYESVMPGHKLDPDKWITIVASGQLSDEEIIDLVNHSVLLVKAEAS